MTKNIKPILLAVFIAFIVLPFYWTRSYAQSPQETLNQYISDLQKNPNDYALREKIVKHVQTMKPAPAVPEEAKKYVNRGVAAGEGAKTENDYKDAIDEFQKAVNIAPWLGAGYRGLAVMQDKAGQYSQALQNLKLFLLTNPSTADTEAAKTLRDKIEYRQEKATKETSAEAIAERPKNKQEEFIRSLQGAVWVRESADGCRRYEITLMEDRLTGSCVLIKDCELERRGRRCPEWDDTHYGRLAAARVNGFQIYGPNWKGEITPDGKIIKFYLPNWMTGQGTWEVIYFRER